MPSLGLFFLLLVFLVQLRCDAFCFILYFVLLLSFRSLFFSKERQKGNGSRWEGVGEEQRGVEGGETLIRMYHMSKESIFEKRGNTLKKSSSSSPQSVRHCSDILRDSQEYEHNRPVGSTAEDALDSINYVYLCTCIGFCIISIVILTALKDESCICVIS